MAKVGRPYKGDKPRRSINLYLPDDFISEMDAIVAKRREKEQGYSRSDYIIAALQKERRRNNDNN